MTSKLTVKDIEAGYENDEWAGWGYLGERDAMLDRRGKSLIPKMDRLVLKIANAAGWTKDNLFHWTNSKYGRHFVDQAFGCSDLAGAAVNVRLDGLEDVTLLGLTDEQFELNAERRGERVGD